MRKNDNIQHKLVQVLVYVVLEREHNQLFPEEIGEHQQVWCDAVDQYHLYHADKSWCT